MGLFVCFVDGRGYCSEDGTVRWLKWELCQTDEMLTVAVRSVQSDFQGFGNALGFCFLAIPAKVEVESYHQHCHTGDLTQL